MKLFFIARTWNTMKPSTIRIVFLFLLLAFSLWIRTHELSLVPPFLLEKETRVGLIAYSLIQSDLVSYQSLFSQNVASIDNSTLGPLSILATIPFVKTFGLSIWSVRFPSALAGFLTVLMFFFCAKLLTETFKKTQSDQQSQRVTAFPSIATLCLIFFALSPWHIQISRIDTGLNLGLFFFLLGTFLTLKIPSNPKLLFFWTIPFVLSIYSDFTFFLPSIAFILIALLVFRRAFSLRLSGLILSLLIALLLILPILQRSLSYTTHRDDAVTSQLINKENQAINRITYSNNTLLSNILFNKNIENLKLYLEHFTSYMQPQQLFTQFTGSEDRISPYSGLFSPLDFIFLISGISFLIRHNKKSLVFFLSWITIVLLPLAMTSSNTDILRSILIIPPIIVLLALGCGELLHSIKARRRFFFLAGISLIFSYFFLRFVFFYFSSYKSTFHDYRQEYSQAFSFTTKHITEKKYIVVTDISFGQDLYLTWLFSFPSSKFDFGYTKKLKDPNIIKNYGNYSFVSKPPSRYYLSIVYIQPRQTIPKKARILFNSSSPLKKDQITVFTVTK